MFRDCGISWVSSLTITKTSLFEYTENFNIKNEKFQIKILIFFHISAQNIDCGFSLEPPWRGGPNEYPQSMFLSRNKKNKVSHCKPQFNYIKVGFKGVNIMLACLSDAVLVRSCVRIFKENTVLAMQVKMQIRILIFFV